MISAKQRLIFLLLLLMLPLLFLADVLLGSVSIPLQVFFDLMSGEEVSSAHELIILKSRLPKALTAMLCGSALAISGLLMQTLFRNPLAGPYILGVSSGAGLGVALLVMGASFFGFSVGGSMSLPLASMLGSFGILFILFLLSLKVKDIMTLLILGIMIGSIATAVIGLIQYFSSDAQLKSFLIWTLGSLEGLNPEELKRMYWFIFPGILLSLGINKKLNALLLGEQYAKSLGIALNKTRLIIILISGSLAGIITAYCGPIGFIGIIIPHLARLLLQTSNHLLLIPASVLLGAAVLLLSDVLAQLPSGGISLPINSVTSIIGIPIIIWIIFHKRSISKSF